MLITVTIIGLLSSVGAISYDTVKANSRDTKRVSDTKQIQVSLEFFFENNSYYPADGVPGPEGRILGQPDSIVFSDSGFDDAQQGTLYMLTVPRNPEPNGSPYIYRSLFRDGRNCDREPCDAYALVFTLERPQGSLLAGPHAITPTGTAGAEGGYAGLGVETAGGAIIGTEGLEAVLARYAAEAQRVADDPAVELAAEAAVAPVATAAAVVNVSAMAQATAQASQYLLYFISQPLLLFGRRRRKAWGTVYNALSKLPEDLAVVRLKDAASGRIVRSAVTDTFGRFSFLAPPGTYRIEASKAKFVFPCATLDGKKVDGKYLDLYFGGPVEVGTGGALLTPNIPLDPADESVPDEKVIRDTRKRGFQSALALGSPVLGGVSIAIKPSALVIGLFAAQLLAYLFFRRLAAAHRPKTRGTVYDEQTGRPVQRAVVRIFAMPYHKLLETQVTDRQGSYSFRVGSNVYYVTVTKPGYLKTETDPLDLSAVTEPTAIASDIPLRPAPLGSVLKKPV